MGLWDWETLGAETGGLGDEGELGKDLGTGRAETRGPWDFGSDERVFGSFLLALDT